MSLRPGSSVKINRSVFLLSNFQSPRLRYLIDVIFKRQLELPIKLIHSQEDYNEEGSILLHYGSTVIKEADLNFFDCGLLKEEFIRRERPKISTANVYPSAYMVPPEKNDSFAFTFDIFSWCFYLLSRYEEYQDHQPDRLGRYAGSTSVAGIHGFLEMPVVDLWVQEIKKKLEGVNGAGHSLERRYVNRPTVDIDIPYAYRGKGWKNWAGLSKDLLQFKFSRFANRCQFLGTGPDPFDQYEMIEDSFSKNHLSAVYFFLLNYKKPYDENHIHSKPEYHNLIRQIANTNKVGVHPSFSSTENTGLVLKEKNKLENILNNSVIRSRHHYLKINLPETYRTLIDCGIKEDYSMAYADRLGFRSSTSIPFPWFDLGLNTPTDLIVFPSCVMDASMRWYMEMTVDMAISSIRSIHKRVKDVQGQFIWIWHNSSFSPVHGWKGWEKVFLELCSLK